MTILALANRIQQWIIRNFGEKIFLDRQERGRRFIEEGLELCQALEVSKEDILRLVDRVYSNPVGDIQQELGGVGITLLGLTSAIGLDLAYYTKEELLRLESLPVSYWWARHVAKVEAGISTKAA